MTIGRAFSVQVRPAYRAYRSEYQLSFFLRGLGANEVIKKGWPVVGWRSVGGRGGAVRTGQSRSTKHLERAEIFVPRNRNISQLANPSAFMSTTTYETKCSLSYSVLKTAPAVDAIGQLAQPCIDGRRRLYVIVLYIHRCTIPSQPYSLAIITVGLAVL